MSHASDPIDRELIDGLLAENARLRAERLKLDRRIHNQRVALRQNWEIIEMRAQYKRAWYPSRLLTSLLHRVTRTNPK